MGALVVLGAHFRSMFDVRTLATTGDLVSTCQKNSDQNPCVPDTQFPDRGIYGPSIEYVSKSCADCRAGRGESAQGT